MKLSLIRNLIVGIVLLQVSPAQGQEKWEKKPYQEWTLSEVVRILDDSPWAQTASGTFHMNYGSPGVSYSVTVRLRSALPIRQALIRGRQLAVNYDKFSDADKKRFDAETKDFLECSDCAKYYLVTISSYMTGSSPPRSVPGGTLPGSYGVDISEPLRSLTLNDLKPHVHLSNDKGERRALAGFIPPKGVGKQAMFIFPRFDSQGDPLITPAHKKLYFEIDRRILSNMVEPLRKFSFDVRRLVQNGQIVF